MFELCARKCSYWCYPSSKPNDGDEIEERHAIFELLLESHAEANYDSNPTTIDFGNCLAPAIDAWPNSKLVISMIRNRAGIRGHLQTYSDAPDGGLFSPLQLATRRNCSDITRDLLENGADINEPASHGGGTALQMACKPWYDLTNNLELVQYLLDHGADINANPADDYGKTALQHACTNYWNYELIDLLLARGADVNGPPAKISGRTALQIACMNKPIDFKLINLLLEKGANINASAAQTKGITALQGAVISGNVELVLCLLERGAEVDAPGAQVDGRTALEAAAEHGRLTITQVLLNAYRNVGVTPELDRPLELAEKEGHFGVVKLFKDHSTA